jgi:hypothetical protein
MALREFLKSNAGGEDDGPKQAPHSGCLSIFLYALSESLFLYNLLTNSD